jgi:acyl-CoA thioester hydrolase
MTAPEFRFYHPIEVRYGDLDSQRHVNHAKYFTYMEMARARYMERLGLWEGRDFDGLGVIVAQASCNYRQAIRFGQPIRVGVRTVHLGGKSWDLAYRLEDDSTYAELADGRTIMVAYDYRQERSMPIPAEWRTRIKEFEGL